ncbi:ABC transporter permease [Hypericibacter sp.]|uniref:ABC transporter permease n=1 Tax=Hypericibacter sp. TaxID=2705401 RepID=UPI003D6CBFF5
MTAITHSSGARRAATDPWIWVWLGALLLSALLYVFRDAAPWAVDYPKEWIVPLSAWISAVMGWIKTNFTWLTRGFSGLIAIPLDAAFGLLAKSFKIGHGADALVIPRLSWVGIVIAVALAGLALGGRSIGIVAGACFLYLAIFGQWESSMLTLALIAICVPFCVVTGILVGILGYRHPAIDRLLITPILDLMQTMPTFAYLVPMLLLFGNNPVSALLATGIFATPPMVRATILALNRVPQEIGDFGTMAGCTRLQKLWRVLVPAARPTLMVGVNQVIMLSLNMVIISSMIGAGGLGYDVLLAMRALKVGQALEAGLAIVALAIALDQLSQAAARRRPTHRIEGTLWQRHPYLVSALAALAVTTLISIGWPPLYKVPSSITISTAPIWKSMVDWINLNFFDIIEVVRTFMLLHILNPTRAFLDGMPWLAATGLLGLAGWRLGGPKLAILAAGLTFFCAAVGLWEKTMATVYLCGIGSIISALIGIPIGVWGARSDKAHRIITPIIDTLQTLPSFVFLIPVVMLFRVGDVTALIAVVSFAIVPAIRYTDHGIRQVPPALIEAARVSGCTRQQIFRRVQFPLALPEIMLGINQTILLALSMLIIAAMVGTRDLGQEVFISLAKADSGRGIVAGLAVAFIGIVADRLIGAGSARARRRLGLA